MMSSRRPGKASKLHVDTASTSSKYLGEAGDRHFQPKSPLISRQQLTPLQEQDLLRACTNVLQGVQHSDAEVIPDLLHLSTHVVVESPQVTHRTHDSHRSEKSRNPQSATSARRPAGRPRTRPNHDDTTTPSTISKHDIGVRTNDTTPMTSVEASPQDLSMYIPDKGPAILIPHFSDTSRPQQKSRSSQHVYDGHDHVPMKLATKSFTNVATLSFGQTRAQGHSSSRTAIALKKHFVKRPEYNKSLPDVPKLDFSYETAEDPWSTRNASLDLPRRQRTAPVNASSRSKLNHPADPSNVENAHSKSRFQFLSVFGKKRSKQT